MFRHTRSYVPVTSERNRGGHNLSKNVDHNLSTGRTSEEFPVTIYVMIIVGVCLNDRDLTLSFTIQHNRRQVFIEKKEILRSIKFHAAALCPIPYSSRLTSLKSSYTIPCCQYQYCPRPVLSPSVPGSFQSKDLDVMHVCVSYQERFLETGIA